MVSRLDKHEYENNANNSRVVRNQDLYKQLYDDDSYLEESQPSLDRTTEIDIEKVRELLRSRETYRKEMKMREYNILKQDVQVENPETETEEKNYDINEYLNKAAHEKEFQPYHKINVEPVVEEAEEEIDEEDEAVLEQMGNTELSLNMFEDLTSSDDEDDEEITKEITAEIETEDDESEEDEDSEETEDEDEDEAFFTSSIKIHVSDTEEDEDESRRSLVVKIIMIALVVIIIVLLVILLFL